MKVEEVLNMLSYGTDFRLVGARTGKILHDSIRNKKEHLEQFKNLEIRDKTIRADLWVSKAYHSEMIEYAKPIISIWVSGK